MYFLFFSFIDSLIRFHYLFFIPLDNINAWDKHLLLLKRILVSHCISCFHHYSLALVVQQSLMISVFYQTILSRKNHIILYWTSFPLHLRGLKRHLHEFQALTLPGKMSTWCPRCFHCLMCIPESRSWESLTSKNAWEAYEARTGGCVGYSGSVYHERNRGTLKGNVPHPAPRSNVLPRPIIANQNKWVFG